MLHRLPVLGGFGTEAEVAADVKTALQIQDILPFWVDRLTAISFRPLTRIDLRRAFMIAAIQKPEVVSGYRQLGYDQETAQILADFTEKLRDRAIIKLLPVRMWRGEDIDRATARQMLLDDDFPAEPVDKALETAEKLQSNNSNVKLYERQKITKAQAIAGLSAHGITAANYNKWLDDAEKSFDDHKAAKEYRDGLISKADATAEMTAAGLKAATVTDLLDKADKFLDNKAGQRCGNFLVDRFILGEFDGGQLRQELLGIGLQSQIADRIVRVAECELAAKGRQPSTAQLCQFLEQGSITQQEFNRRLITLGYSGDDAAGILLICTSKLTAKQQREAEKMAKQQAAEQKKQQNRMTKQFKQFDTAADKRRKNLKTAKAAELRRERNIAAAADRLAKAEDKSLAVALIDIRAAVSSVRVDFLFTIDEAIQAVTLATAKLNDKPGGGFDDRLQAVAAHMAGQTDDDKARQLIDSASRNGETNES